MFKIFSREKLIPGNGGRDCPHNGYGKKNCLCDECDWSLCCYPEYSTNHRVNCSDCNILCPRKKKR